MNPQSTAFAVLFGVILANQVLTRTSFGRHSAVFYALQAANAALAIGIVAMGVPGFEHAAGFRFALAGVFVFRFVWNALERRSENQEERRAQLEAEREQLRAHIEGSEPKDEP